MALIEPLLDSTGEGLAEELSDLTKATIQHFPIESYFFHVGAYDVLRTHMAHPALLPELPLGLTAAHSALKESHRYWGLLVVAACLEEYLASLVQLSEPDGALATQLVADLLEYCRSPTVVYRCLVPVLGVEVENPIMQDAITVRRTGYQDGALPSRSGSTPMIGPELSSDALNQGILAPPPLPVTIELRQAVAKDSGNTLHQDMSELLLSFQLSGYPLASGDGYGVIDSTVPWIPLERSDVTFAALLDYNVPQTPHLAEVDLRNVLGIHRRIQQHDDTTALRDFALRRFVSGLRRSGAADTVVDFVTALECVLLPGGNPNELRFRFAANGAALTRPPGRERLERYCKLLELYDARSSAVHRPKSDSEKAMKQGAWSRVVMDEDVRELTRSILLEAVTRQTWPTPGDFLTMLFAPSST